MKQYLLIISIVVICVIFSIILAQKKNIAICLVGRIKDYEYNKSSLETMIKNFSKKGKLHFFVSLNTQRDDYHIEFENYIQKFGKCYFYYEKLVDHSNIQSMFYNQLQCWNLIEKSKIKFKIVMKWRTEIKFEKLFSIGKINDNTIYIPNIYDTYIFNESNYNLKGYNDQIAFGNYNTMKIYSNIYNHLKNYGNKKAEEYILLHLGVSKVNVERFPFTYILEKNIV